MLRWGEGTWEELCKNREEGKCFAGITMASHARSWEMLLGSCDIVSTSLNTDIPKDVFKSATA